MAITFEYLKRETLIAIRTNNIGRLSELNKMTAKYNERTIYKIVTNVEDPKIISGLTHKKATSLFWKLQTKAMTMFAEQTQNKKCNEIMLFVRMETEKGKVKKNFQVLLSKNM